MQGGAGRPLHHCQRQCLREFLSPHPPDYGTQGGPVMDKAKLRQYARQLMVESARDQNFVGIFEAADWPITDGEARFVVNLIRSALMRITWEDDNA